MIVFILRRVVLAIPLLLVASALVFGLVAQIDPLADQRSNPRVTAEQLATLEEEYGLDVPVVERYWDWLGDLVHGDMGTSIEEGDTVTSMLARAIPVTLRLLLVSTVISMLLGVTIGVVGAVRQYGWFDNTSTFVAFLFFAMPTFWLATVLKDLAIRLNDWLGRQIFFTIGEQTPRLDAGLWGTWIDRLGHLVLPGLTLILIQLAATSRFQRSSMLEVLNTDYVRTARAKGVPEHRVITRHALRNALLPVVSFNGVTFGTLIAGAIVTETVFEWRGMGRLGTRAIVAGDLPVIQGWLLVTGIAVVLVNLITDVALARLDPRIRNE